MIIKVDLSKNATSKAYIDALSALLDTGTVEQLIIDPIGIGGPVADKLKRVPKYPQVTEGR